MVGKPEVAKAFLTEAYPWTGDGHTSQSISGVKGDYLVHSRKAQPRPRANISWSLSHYDDIGVGCLVSYSQRGVDVNRLKIAPKCLATGYGGIYEAFFLKSPNEIN